MKITQGVMLRALKRAYENYTGRLFPYETELMFDRNLLGFGALECLANPVKESLMKVGAFDVIRINRLFIEDEDIPLKKKREVLMHELAHILRIEEQNFLVNTGVDSHDERWKEIMKSLGIENPTNYTTL